MLSSVPLKTGDVKSLLHSALVNTPPSITWLRIKNIILNTRKHLEEKQTILVSGVVTDETGELLIGASVSVKGSTQGVITNANGEFILNTRPDAVLVVSYLGYISQEIPVRNKTNIKVVLKEDQKTLEEVVVIGYGTLKRKEITGSHTSVKMNTIPPIGGANRHPISRRKSSGVNHNIGLRPTGRKGESSDQGRSL